MEKVKEIFAVVNTGKKDYREKFNEKEYFIPAGKHIKLARREALDFVGNCPGTDPATGRLIEKPLKVARGTVEIIDNEPETFTSPFTGDNFATEAELNAHIDLFKSAHPEMIEPAKAPEVQSEPDTGLLTCPICALKVRGKHGLQIHLKSCRE